MVGLSDRSKITDCVGCNLQLTVNPFRRHSSRHLWIFTYIFPLNLPIKGHRSTNQEVPTLSKEQLQCEFTWMHVRSWDWTAFIRVKMRASMCTLAHKRDFFFFKCNFPPLRKLRMDSTHSFINGAFGLLVSNKRLLFSCHTVRIYESCNSPQQLCIGDGKSKSKSCGRSYNILRGAVTENFNKPRQKLFVTANDDYTNLIHNCQDVSMSDWLISSYLAGLEWPGESTAGLFHNRFGSPERGRRCSTALHCFCWPEEVEE